MEEQAGQGRIAVVSTRARAGDRIEVVGTGWADCPIEIAIRGERVTPWKLIQGFPISRLFRPDADGEFIVQVATFELAPGRVQVSATQPAHAERKPAVAEIELLARPMPQSSDDQEDDGDQEASRPYLRAQTFLTQ